MERCVTGILRLASALLTLVHAVATTVSEWGMVDPHVLTSVGFPGIHPAPLTLPNPSLFGLCVGLVISTGDFFLLSF